MNASEAEAVAAFVRIAAATARTLPLNEAGNFLRGALLLCGDEPAVEPLRKVYQHLVCSDAQLELIASAQRQLSFTTSPAR